MSEIKNGGLDQYGAGPFEQQQFGTAGVQGVNDNSELLDVTVVLSDKQQHLYTSFALSSSPSTTTTTRVSAANSHKDDKPTTTTTCTRAKLPTIAAVDADVNGDDYTDSSTRRRQRDPVAAMSRITVGVNRSKSSSPSPSRLHDASSVCEYKYGVEIKDLTVLEQVRHHIFYANYTFIALRPHIVDL